MVFLSGTPFLDLTGEVEPEVVQVNGSVVHLKLGLPEENFPTVMLKQSLGFVCSLPVIIRNVCQWRTRPFNRFKSIRNKLAGIAYPMSGPSQLGNVSHFKRGMMGDLRDR